MGCSDHERISLLRAEHRNKNGSLFGRTQKYFPASGAAIKHGDSVILVGHSAAVLNDCESVGIRASDTCRSVAPKELLDAALRYCSPDEHSAALEEAGATSAEAFADKSLSH